MPLLPVPDVHGSFLKLTMVKRERTEKDIRVRKHYVPQSSFTKRSHLFSSAVLLFGLPSISPPLNADASSDLGAASGGDGG